MIEKNSVLQKTIECHESEPETGEGKKELLLKAKEHEKRRDKALLRDPWFDNAEGLLQISIVLASVTIVTSTAVLLLGCLAIGGSGTLSKLNGYDLLFL